MLNYATPAIGRFASQPAYSRINCQWTQHGLRLDEPPLGKVRWAYRAVGAALLLLCLLLLYRGTLEALHDGHLAAAYPFAVFATLTLIGGALAIGEGEAQRRRALVIEVRDGWLTVARPTVFLPRRRWAVTAIRRVRADPAGREFPSMRAIASLIVAERFLWRSTPLIVRPSEECRWLAAILNAAVAEQRTAPAAACVQSAPG